MKILSWKREQPLRATVSFTRQEAEMITQDEENLTKHNKNLIQDFKKVKLKSLVPKSWMNLTKEEAEMDVWVKS